VTAWALRNSLLHNLKPILRMKGIDLMTKPLLIATSIALALAVTACGRDDRAVVTTPPPSSPVDSTPSQSPSGVTSGMGSSGTLSGPDASKGADATTGMGTNPQADPAAQPYGSQSSTPQTGTPSSAAGSTAR
jgi:hypothetical protein